MTDARSAASWIICERRGAYRLPWPTSRGHDDRDSSCQSRTGIPPHSSTPSSNASLAGQLPRRQRWRRMVSGSPAAHGNLASRKPSLARSPTGSPRSLWALSHLPNSLWSIICTQLRSSCIGKLSCLSPDVNAGPVLLYWARARRPLTRRGDRLSCPRGSSRTQQPKQRCPIYLTAAPQAQVWRHRIAAASVNLRVAAGSTHDRSGAK